jgi:myo-inositol-1(or 4)-monophosphatase
MAEAGVRAVKDEEPAALLQVARAAAQAGAAVALSWREDAAGLHVEEKAASDDLVSQADREAEAAIREVLGARRPADAILGEEAPVKPGASGIEWAVDPIDGTTNYLYGRPDWAVSVAAVRVDDGQVLAGVVTEPSLGISTEARLAGGTWSDGQRVRCPSGADLSRALIEVNFGRPDQRPLAGRCVDALLPHVRDVRRGGSAAAALAQVATGRADAYWGPGLRAWDGAAGLLLVAEAGGTVGDLSGATPAAWPPSGDILAAAAGLWPPLRSLLAQTLSA